MSKIISIGLRDYSKRMLSISSYLRAQAKETLYYSGKLLGTNEFVNENSKTLEDALTKVSDTYARFSEASLKVARLGSNFLTVELYGCPTCVEAKHDGLTYCWIDAGYIAGALEKMMGKRFAVIETKCRGTGYDYCEFVVTENRSSEARQPKSIAFKRFEKSPM
jgi:predicted hydrocarbon binding protein